MTQRNIASLLAVLVAIGSLAAPAAAQAKKSTNEGVRAGKIVKIRPHERAFEMRSKSNGNLRVEVGRQAMTLDGKKVQLHKIKIGDQVVVHGTWKRESKVLVANQTVKVRRNDPSQVRTSSHARPTVSVPEPAPSLPSLADPEPELRVAAESPFPDVRRNAKASISGTIQRTLDVATAEGKYFVIELEDPRTQTEYRIEFKTRSIAIAWEERYRWPLDRKKNMIMSGPMLFNDFYLPKGRFVQVVGTPDGERFGRKIFRGYWIDLDPTTR